MIDPDRIRQAVSASGNDTLFSLEVSAGSKTDRFPTGFNSWRDTFGIQVKAPAVDGKANKAVIALIAAFFSVPKNSVRLVSGQTSTVKRICIEDIDPDTILAMILPLVTDTADPGI